MTIIIVKCLNILNPNSYYLSVITYTGMPHTHTYTHTQT